MPLGIHHALAGKHHALAVVAEFGCTKSAKTVLAVLVASWFMCKTECGGTRKANWGGDTKGKQVRNYLLASGIQKENYQKCHTANDLYTFTKNRSKITN